MNDELLRCRLKEMQKSFFPVSWSSEWLIAWLWIYWVPWMSFFLHNAVGIERSICAMEIPWKMKTSFPARIEHEVLFLVAAPLLLLQVHAILRKFK